MKNHHTHHTITSGKSLVFWTFLFLLIFSLTNHCYGESFSLRGYKNGDMLPSFKATSVSNTTKLTFSPKGETPSLIIFFSVTPAFRQKRSLTVISQVRDLIDNEFAGKIRTALVFSDNQEKPALKKMIDDRIIPTPVFDDSDKKIYNQFGVFMTPIVVLSSADGTLHEVVPATYNLPQLLRNNLKLLLGEWNKEDFKNSFKPTYSKRWTKEEKAYLRHINYGKIMSSRKMFSPAVREFATAAKIIPKGYEAQIGLGQVYMRTRKYDKAVTSFSLALKISPDSTTALAGLGVSYFWMGEKEKAVTLLENALISKDPDLEAILALAQIYEDQGDIEKAIRLNKLAVLKLQSQVD